MDNLPKITDPILVLGDVMRDTIILPEGEMARGSDVRAKIRALEGGSGANQAMWLSKNDVKVKFIARVGASDFTHYKNRFLAHNIEALLQKDENNPTGHLVTLVDYKDGERSFFTDRAANTRLSLKEIPSDIFSKIGLLQISGYAFFEPSPRKVALDLIRQAKALNIPFSIDPASSSFIKQVGIEKFLNWTRGARFFFPNEEEAEILSGTNNLKKQIEILGDYFEFVIIKRAEKGAVIGTKQHGIIADEAAQRIRAVDSSGAGDGFLAGFIAALKSDSSPKNCLIKANKQGATIAAKIGGQPDF
ncbi:MAG: carbohydrate kinase family protein [Devosiaceae bacterium]|nr:carbohydrate kinase family protein [Devosiaceae bacterium]